MPLAQRSRIEIRRALSVSEWITSLEGISHLRLKTHFHSDYQQTRKSYKNAYLSEGIGPEERETHLHTRKDPPDLIAQKT